MQAILSVMQAILQGQCLRAPVQQVVRRSGGPPNPSAFWRRTAVESAGTTSRDAFCLGRVACASLPARIGGRPLVSFALLSSLFEFRSSRAPPEGPRARFIGGLEKAGIKRPVSPACAQPCSPKKVLGESNK